MKTLQVILALSALILIHETGHFTFARLFGIRVDKFFLFFDIGGVKLFSTRSRWFLRLFPKAASWETEYGIGWLPLGGYCKISGMIDESMDLESLSGEPKPWEFRTRPAWQRLLVMGGGVLYNFIFAIIVYIAIAGIWGTAYLPNENCEIYAGPLAEKMGFRTGDRVLMLDDYVPEDFSRLQLDLVRRDVRKATVLRGEDTLDLYIDQNYIPELLQTPDLFDLAVPFTVESFMEGSLNADRLQPGDRIVEIDGAAVPYVQDSRKILRLHPGETVLAGVIRGEDTLAIPLQIDSAGMLGIFTKSPVEASYRSYSFFEAIPEGLKLTLRQISGYIQDLRLVFTPRTEAYKSVGSFIAIGQIFPSAWNWYAFLNILAVLSIMLGVMNLLPIPALDGGHIVFLLYEIIARRKPSDRFMAVAQTIGMILLFLLMFLAFGNDIGRLLR